MTDYQIMFSFNIVFTNAIFMDFFSDIRTILWVIGSCISIAGSYFIYKRTIRVKHNRQTLDATFFVDRTEAFADAVKLLCSNNKVLQVNGNSGMGKSDFLKILADIVNKRVSKKFIKCKKLDSSLKCLRGYNAFYIEGKNADEFKNVIEHAAKTHFNANDIDNAEAFARLVTKSVGKRKLILIFDNINDISIHRALNDFIKSYLITRRTDRIIVGTQSNFSYDIEYGVITLNHFENNDILELAKIYGRSLENNLDAIKHSSMGLPVFLGILLKNTEVEGYNDLDKELIMIFESLDENDKRFFLSILLISMIETQISKQKLYRLSTHNPDESLTRLHNKNLIICYQDSIKVHDLIAMKFFSFTITSRIKVLDFDQIVIELIDLFSTNDHLIIFLNLLVSKNVESVTYSTDKIREYLDCEIDNENYVYVLTLGKYIFEYINYYELNLLRSERTFSLYLHKIYILSLQYVGRRNEALLELDKYKKEFKPIRINEILSLDEFETFYIEADTLHLNNCFTEALEQFRLLLNVAKDRNFDEFHMKCLYQIAHNERHRGKDLLAALEWYKKTTEYAKKINNLEFHVRGMIGEMSIHIIMGSIDYNFQLYIDLLTNLVAKSNENSSIRAYLYKYIGRFNLRFGSLDSAYANYKLADEIYDLHSSRKNMYMLFEWAEYHRLIQKSDKAEALYDKCIVLAKNCNETNFETYSRFGKLLLKTDENIYAIKEECNELIANAIKINNTFLKDQIQLYKHLHDHSIEYDRLKLYYKKHHMNNEAKLIEKIKLGKVNRNEIQLNLA